MKRKYIMIHTGIVSVTFRGLAPQAIADLTVRAGLEAVEWGGDVHVPPQDPANAAAVGELTRAAGLAVASYGSYFAAGYSPAESFDAELAAARALGAPNIRIWAGKKGSASEEDRARVASSIHDCAERCRAAGMTLSLEFHQNTLTDHYESACRLVGEAASPALRLYWQPDQFRDEAYNLAALRAVLPVLSNVHVFAWEGRTHFPLAHAETIWRKYIDLIREAKGDRSMLLEFVCDGSEAQYLRDAETLRTWLGA